MCWAAQDAEGLAESAKAKTALSARAEIRKTEWYLN